MVVTGLDVVEKWVRETEAGRLWLVRMAEEYGAPVQALFPFVEEELDKTAVPETGRLNEGELNNGEVAG